MTKLNQEPEFVFYHNPILDIRGIHADITASEDMKGYVERCFRKLSEQEIKNLQPRQIVYVSRQIYGDKRIWNPRELFDGFSGNLDTLQGLVRATISNQTPRGFEYITKGDCTGLIMPQFTEGVFDSPNLEEINELIVRFGEGIFTPPTREDGKRFKHK